MDAQEVLHTMSLHMMGRALSIVSQRGPALAVMWCVVHSTVVTHMLPTMELSRGGFSANGQRRPTLGGVALQESLAPRTRPSFRTLMSKLLCTPHRISWTTTSWSLSLLDTMAILPRDARM